MVEKSLFSSIHSQQLHVCLESHRSHEASGAFNVLHQSQRQFIFNSNEILF